MAAGGRHTFRLRLPHHVVVGVGSAEHRDGDVVDLDCVPYPCGPHKDADAFAAYLREVYGDGCLVAVESSFDSGEDSTSASTPEPADARSLRAALDDLFYEDIREVMAAVGGSKWNPKGKARAVNWILDNATREQINRALKEHCKS